MAQTIVSAFLFVDMKFKTKLTNAFIHAYAARSIKTLLLSKINVFYPFQRKQTLFSFIN